MKNILLVGFLALSPALFAQYYYNDIITTLEVNRTMKTFQDNKVRAVTAIGYDKQGVKAGDFSEYQEIKENGAVLKHSSISRMNKIVTYSRFDKMGRIISLADSSVAEQSMTTYEYDAAGRLTKLQNNITDSARDFNQTETHYWLYNSSGKPEKMWRIITHTDDPGAADSLEIRFIADEHNNPAEERTFRKGRETGYLYYYYDEKNRLTDIVRYNTRLKKLLPDVMFEYDENDRVIQKITPTSSISLGYLIWRYVFDNRGLKTKEALFNDDKQMTGKIEYAYSFQQ